MKTIITLQCPKHGEFKVEVDREPHTEMRDEMMSQFSNIIPRFTGKCPVCGRRIEFDNNYED